MSGVKPCAACGHPKSHHRVGYCKRQSESRDSGFGPKYLITRDCPCKGYEYREVER